MKNKQYNRWLCISYLSMDVVRKLHLDEIMEPHILYMVGSKQTRYGIISNLNRTTF